MIWKEFLQYGALGLVCAAAIWDISYLQKQTFRVIENNTKALAELQKVVESCQRKQERDNDYARRRE